MVDDDPSDPPDPDDPDAGTDRLQLSVAQVAASSLAAVSAAVVCSFFGVAGTVIGTAIASFVATVGSALYAHSLRRTQARLRRLHQAGAASPPLTEVIKTTRRQGRRVLAQVQWRIVLQGAATVFVFSIGLLSAFELTVGKTVSAELGVSHAGGGKTSLGSLAHAGPKRSHKPKPTPSPTTTSSSTASSSPSGSPSESPSSAPPTSPPASPSHTPTAPSSSTTPTVSPSTTVTPSVSATTAAVPTG